MQACTLLVHLIEADGSAAAASTAAAATALPPVALLQRALEAVARGLAAARHRIEQAAAQLQAVQRGPWLQSVLAAVDAYLHSQRWHAACHAADGGGGGKEAYSQAAAAARDLLRDHALPLLCEAAAQQQQGEGKGSGGSGFLLAPHFRALLDMGTWVGGCLARGVGGWHLSRR